MHTKVPGGGQQAKYGSQNVVRRLHRALIRRTQAREAQRGQINVSIPVANVKLPAVVRESTVSLDNHKTFDDDVDAADAGEGDLDLAVKASVLKQETQDALLPGLRPAVDFLQQRGKVLGHRSENVAQLPYADRPEKKSVVERCDRVPHVLTKDYLGQGIRDADRNFRTVLRILEWRPVSLYVIVPSRR